MALNKLLMILLRKIGKWKGEMAMEFLLNYLQQFYSHSFSVQLENSQLTCSKEEKKCKMLGETFDIFIFTIGVRTSKAGG